MLLLATIIPAIFVLWDAFFSLIKRGVTFERHVSLVIRAMIVIPVFYFILHNFNEKINPIYITVILLAAIFSFIFFRRNIDFYTLKKFNPVQCEEILENMLNSKHISYDKRYEKEEQWTRYDKKVIYELKEENEKIELVYNGNKQYPSIRMKAYHLEDRYLLQELLPDFRAVQENRRLQLHVLYQVVIGLGLLIIGVLPNIT